MKTLIALISLVAASAYADTFSTIPGNYNRVDGKDCPDTQLFDLDLNAQAVLWWQTNYPAEKVCHKDHSQLDTPEFCYQSEFEGTTVTLTEHHREYIFGIIPGAGYTNTTKLEFSNDYQTVVVTADGDAQYSSKYKCTYKKAEGSN